MTNIDFSEIYSLLGTVKKQIESVVIGKPEAVELALTAFLAKGNILLEDLPGTGKTTLAKTIAGSLGCEYNRVQFTPDLMPADITGMNFYNAASGKFEFRPGPVFTNILLADEINRTTPRTQSALLEAMEEKQVTIDGVTHQLRAPFMVLATQNPVDMEGTYPLPFAQQDRFLLRIKLGYPQRSDEALILARHAFANPADTLAAVLETGEAQSLQDMTGHVHLAESLVQYILDIVEATRLHDAVELALSPRASLSMVRAAKARALLKERDYVLPDDIKVLAQPIFSHRLKLKKTEKYKGRDTDAFVAELLETIPVSLEDKEQ